MKIGSTSGPFCLSKAEKLANPWDRIKKREMSDDGIKFPCCCRRKPQVFDPPGTGNGSVMPAFKPPAELLPIVPVQQEIPYQPRPVRMPVVPVGGHVYAAGMVEDTEPLPIGIMRA